MSHVKIHEDQRTLSRTELAAELRQVASQLESGGDVSYGDPGAGGSIAVPEQIQREVEIEQTKDGAGVKFDIEIKWATAPNGPTAASDTQPNP